MAEFETASAGASLGGPVGSISRNPTTPHPHHNNVSKDRPQNETERGASKLSSMTEDTIRLVSILEKRLGSVLRPVSPSDDPRREELECVTVVGKFLQAEGTKVENTNRTLSHIIDRLEV